MSRIGRKPIPLPQGVKVEIGESSLEVKGPKGALTCIVPPGVKIVKDGGGLKAVPNVDDGSLSAMHGLARSLAANAVKGVTEGFSKNLEVVGVGYKISKKGNAILFTLGYSHPIEFPLPEGISATLDEKGGKIAITGADKQLVGQIAANIRRLRPPDPYKNKGIRYAGEVLKKKAGKTGTK